MKRYKFLLVGITSILTFIFNSGCNLNNTNTANGQESQSPDRSLSEEKVEDKEENSASEVDSVADNDDKAGRSSEETIDDENEVVSGAEKSDQVETGAASAEPPEVEAEEEEPELDDTVSIVMVGDILLHMPVEEAARDEEGNYNFDAVFANMKDQISGADIAIVNQEVAIGGKELGVSGYPSFNAPYEAGDALVEAGFDVVCHGTNHVLDKGRRSVENTLKYWKENHPEIAVVGISLSQEEADEVTIVERNGIKVAVLNYTYGTNGISLPSDMPFAVELMNEDKIRRDLDYAENNADFTIVCPHWGTEYRLEPDSYQKKWTEIFREGGADLIIGTHPHVIEPVEFLQDDDEEYSNNHGDGDMLVYYSLGNFVSWTSSTGEGVTNRMLGGMAQVNIRRDDNGEVCVSDYDVEAVVCHLRSGHNGVTVYPLSEYTDEMGQENEIISQDPGFSREKCVELCNKVWGTSWH